MKSFFSSFWKFVLKLLAVLHKYACNKTISHYIQGGSEDGSNQTNASKEILQESSHPEDLQNWKNNHYNSDNKRR